MCKCLIFKGGQFSPARGGLLCQLFQIRLKLTFEKVVGMIENFGIFLRDYFFDFF